MANDGDRGKAGDGEKRRRRNTEDLKEEAVKMLLDGHLAASVAHRLGLSRPSLVYLLKRQLIGQTGKTVASLQSRVRELETELRRVKRERDILPLEMSIQRLHIFGLLCF